MTTPSPTRTHETELDRLRRVADEYRRRGYAVTFLPGDDDLARFLRGERPDLLATGLAENVIVEVTRGDRMRGAVDLERLARTVEGRRGSRFELVVAGSAAANVGDAGERRVRRLAGTQYI